MSKIITRKYIQRITKREGDTSIRRNSGGGGGGGGVSQYWVDDNYVSTEFFNRRFEIHDENGDPILPNDVDPATLERTVTLKNEVVYAPVVKGDELGKITLTYQGRVCATVPLLAQYDVAASQFLTAKYQVLQFFAQRTVKLAIVAIVVLCAVCVIPS